MNSILWNAKENRTAHKGDCSAADNAADFNTFFTNFSKRYHVWYETYWQEEKLIGLKTESNGVTATMIHSGECTEPIWYQVGKIQSVGYGERFTPKEIGTYYCEVKGIPAGNNEERSLYSNPVRAGYRVLEYIESNGQNYLDLGYVPTNTTSITFEGAVMSENAAILGGGTAEGAKNTFSLMYENDSELVFFGKSVTIDDRVDAGERHIFRIWRENSKGYLKLDFLKNQSVRIWNKQYSYPLYAVGAINEGGAAMCYGIVRMHALRIYEGEQIVLSLIPIIDAYERAGAYDAKAGRFYESKGTGEFRYE